MPIPFSAARKAPQPTLRLALPTVALAVVALAANCECGAPPDPAAGGELCGTGQIDGTDFAVQAEGSELVLVVKRVEAFGCGALHSHVVLAPQAIFTYDLDSAGKGDVKIVVAAANLDPDDPDLRVKFLPEGENQELSDGDRETIRGSIAEEVKSSEFSTLQFTFKDLSTINGDGTATLESNIAGSTSDAEVSYNAKKEGEKITISGTATIDGAPHGIPRNALGFCVEKDMELNFSVVLVPGTTVCDGEAPDVPAFEETFFDDTACGDVGYNVVYNNVIGPRCAGCHGGTQPNDPTLLRGGATVVLNQWRDFRVDSVRNPGGPLFNIAHDYANVDVALTPGELAMPPSEFGEATPLGDFSAEDPPVVVNGVTYTSELALFNDWITVGLARNAQCADDVAIKTFGRDGGQAVAAGVGGCGGVGYETQQAVPFDVDGSGVVDASDTASASDFFTNNCMYCHAAGDPQQAPSAPPVGSFDVDSESYIVDVAAGALPVTHPFYLDSDGTPLSFWEAGIERAIDGSMFPVALRHQFEDGVNDPFGAGQFAAYTQWVEAGFCE